MANPTTTTAKNTATGVITPEELLLHWQGHRSLTRRVIEAFPEKELFTFSIGGMRPFSELALEMIGMTEPGVAGFVTNEWKPIQELPHHAEGWKPATKEELLEVWDKVTASLDELWPCIAPARFRETVLAFGLYEGPVYAMLQYFVDNEIHHRGQGYVYLRALGIEPPPFWDRNSQITVPSSEA